VNTDPSDVANEAAEQTPDAADANESGGRGPRTRSVLPAGGGNLLLAGLFAAGLGAVYLLSLRDGPATASAAQKQVDLKVTSALQAMEAAPAQPAKKASSLLKTFYNETRKRQIPLAQVAGNPFRFAPLSGASTPQTPKAQDKRPAVAAQQEGLARALRALDTLRLESVVMGGHGGMAMISRNMLSRGQSIEGWTIVQIQPRAVLLRWRDQTRWLHMDNQ